MLTRALEDLVQKSFYRRDDAVFDVDSKAKATRGCQALVRACWQSSTEEENVTHVSYEHMLCCGSTKNASSGALRPEATKFVHYNGNGTPSPLRGSLKSQSGYGN